MPARLLIIALDGADGALLDQWSADGTLPNLAALRARGTATRLLAPACSTDDSLWASFQYASGPGEHGRYYWRQRLDSGRMGMSFLDEAGRDAFWDVLSNEGFRVALIDVPKCGMPRPINGIHLVDWLVHGRYFGQPKSYPESLAAEVVEKFGPAPPSLCAYERALLGDDEVKELAGNLRASFLRKRSAGLHYLEAEAWDLFVIAFKEAHCAGHHLWDLADPRHGDHDAARAAVLGEPLRAIFVDLDSAVGELVAAAGPNARIAVFSTADMAPNATLSHLMPEIVARLNRSLGESVLTRAIRRLRQRISDQHLGPPCEILPYNESCTALRVSSWRHTFRNNPSDNARRVRLCGQVEAMLLELTDADTGQPVVTVIDHPSAGHGSRAAALPDLLARCAPCTIPRAVVSPRLGRIEAEPPPARPGNHAPGGLLILTGEPAPSVTALQDLGPLAARLLRSPA